MFLRLNEKKIGKLKRCIRNRLEVMRCVSTYRLLKRFDILCKKLPPLFEYEESVLAAPDALLFLVRV